MSVVHNAKDGIQLILRYINNNSLLDEFVAIIIDNQSCTNTLFLVDFLDVICLKVAITKALGYAMTMFACLYKLPVILKILKKKGGDGLSLISVYLETCGYVSAVIYNFKRHNHISTYGDICASVIQNFMIILLIWSWGANGVKVSFSHILLVLLLASMLLFGVFQSSGDSIKYISMFSTSVIIFSRLPQIISNATTGNIGVQSIITLFNATLGAILKAWIYYENKDYVQVGGALVAFSLNTILSVQFLYLGGLNEDTKTNVKAIENVSEKAITKETENNKNLRKRVKK